MTPPVAIVTGASQGIGAAIARHFASLGYGVVVNYHKSRDAAGAICAEITAAGGTARPCRADITDESEAAATIALARELGPRNIRSTRWHLA